MHLESAILKEHSKRNTMRIARWVGSDRRRFAQLMRCFLKGEYRITQRAAWIVSYCAEQHPQLLLPYLGRMLDRMMEPGVHVAVKRNVIRILQFITVPKKLQGKVATICFGLLTSQHEPVAVRCFSMTVLANIARQEPELKRELRLVIEQHLPWGTPGINARGKRILRQLNSSHLEHVDS